MATLPPAAASEPAGSSSQACRRSGAGRRGSTLGRYHVIYVSGRADCLVHPTRNLMAVSSVQAYSCVTRVYKGQGNEVKRCSCHQWCAGIGPLISTCCRVGTRSSPSATSHQICIRVCTKYRQMSALPSPPAGAGRAPAPAPVAQQSGAPGARPPAASRGAAQREGRWG